MRLSFFKTVNHTADQAYRCRKGLTKPDSAGRLIENGNIRKRASDVGRDTQLFCLNQFYSPDSSATGLSRIQIGSSSAPNITQGFIRMPRFGLPFPLWDANPGFCPPDELG